MNAEMPKALNSQTGDTKYNLREARSCTPSTKFLLHCPEDAATTYSSSSSSQEPRQSLEQASPGLLRGCLQFPMERQGPKGEQTCMTCGDLPAMKS